MTIIFRLFKITYSSKQKDQKYGVKMPLRQKARQEFISWNHVCKRCSINLSINFYT